VLDACPTLSGCPSLSDTAKSGWTLELDRVGHIRTDWDALPVTRKVSDSVASGTDAVVVDTAIVTI
jgi:hypothetical protein